MELVFETEVGSNNRITIPSKIAKRYGLEKGTWVKVIIQKINEEERGT